MFFLFDFEIINLCFKNITKMDIIQKPSEKPNKYAEKDKNHNLTYKRA